MNMDWERGIWGNGRGEPDVRIIVAGDWSPRRQLEQLAIDEPAALYGNLLDPLRNADLRIMNLEGPLSDRDSPILKDGPAFRLAPAVVAGLVEGGFDVACLANNHAMDHGADALQDTLETLARCGIGSVGAGMTRERALEPAIVEAGDLRLGIVNFCEGEDGTAATSGPGTFGWEPDRVVRGVADLREDVDLVMVVAHAGREYLPAPPPYVQRLFRSIASAGADVIIGHHPHVPQGVEIHGGVPIIYSLGNFILHQRRGSALRRFGLLATVEVAAGAVSGLRLIPCVIGESGARLASPAERAWLFDRLRTVSEILEDPDRVGEVWNAFIDRFGQEFWWRRIGRTQSIRALLASRLGMSRARRDHVEPASRLRNHFITPAHHHFLADGLERLASGTLGSSPPWARDLVESWFDPGPVPAADAEAGPPSR